MKSKCPHPELAKCDKCGKGHPTVLHDENRNQAKERPQQGSGGNNKPNQIKVNSGRVGLRGEQTNNPLMAIIPVTVKSQCSSEYITTYAFLDSGCGAVFIDPEICEVLKIKTRQTKLVIGTINSEEIVNTEIVLGTADGQNFLDLPQSYVKEGIPVSLEDMPRQEDLCRWTHLNSVQIPDITTAGNIIPKVSMIIGMNVPEATLPLETVIGEPGEPYAILTPLGWVLYGISGRNPSPNAVMAHFCRIDQEIQ